MTRQSAVASVDQWRPSAQSSTTSRIVAVEVLVCGSTDRGDDGAPIVAAAMLDGQMPDDVALRIVGQLDIDDLLAIPADAAVVIVDTAVGIRAGQILELPLNALIGRHDRLRPRSSHALAFPEVIGLAELIRGHPTRGRIVAIGGSEFGLGADLSGAVARAVPGLVTAVLDAVERLRA